MSEFEKLFAALPDKQDERRVDRISGHQEELMLTTQQAIAFDNAMYVMIKGCVAGMGAAIDNIDDVVVKAAAIAFFPKILGKNLDAIAYFVSVVGINAAINGHTMSPDAPNCDCANCVAARAIQEVLLEADRVHAAQN